MYSADKAMREHLAEEIRKKQIDPKTLKNPEDRYKATYSGSFIKDSLNPYNPLGKYTSPYATTMAAQGKLMFYKQMMNMGGNYTNFDDGLQYDDHQKMYEFVKGANQEN